MIVKTLLDTDLYKFTTSYAYIKLFPYAMGTFSFNDRNETQYTKDFLFLCPFQFLEFITCHQIQFKFPVDLKLCTDGRREVKASVCFSVCGKRPTDMTFQIRSQSPGLRYIKLRTGIKRNEQLLINRKSATRTDGRL